MTSINSIPNEVLAKIFQWGTSMDQLSTRPFPILVSCVNSHWRALSLGTPSLWNRVVIPVSRGYAKAVLWTAHFLHNSRCCLLHVSLDVSKHTLSREDLTRLTEIYSLLETHVDRIQSLEIRGAWRVCPASNLLAILGHLQCAPRLERLYISLSGTIPSFVAIDPQISEPFPNLKRVWIHGISIQVPFSGLTALVLSSFTPTYARLREISVSCPQLSHLGILQMNPTHNFADNELSSIQLPSIHSLAVSFSHFGMQSSFSILEYLQLPSLTLLEIEGEGDICSCLGKIIATSQLRELRLTNLPRLPVRTRSFNWDACVQLLQSIPTLEVLQLYNATAVGIMKGSEKKSLTRRRSINLSKTTTHTPSRKLYPRHLDSTSSISITEARWPKLHTVAIDTLVAEDVACVCEFVASHSSMRLVKLSKPAQRHLSDSLQRLPGGGFYAPSLASMRDALPAEGTKDCFEWLSERVEIIPLDDDNVSFLDKLFM